MFLPGPTYSISSKDTFHLATRDEFRPKKVLGAVKQDAFKRRLVETAVAFELRMNACAFVRDSRIGTVTLCKRAPVFLLENNSCR